MSRCLHALVAILNHNVWVHLADRLNISVQTRVYHSNLQHSACGIWIVELDIILLSMDCYLLIQKYSILPAWFSPIGSLGQLLKDYLIEHFLNLCRLVHFGWQFVVIVINLLVLALLTLWLAGRESILFLHSHLKIR